MKHTHLFILLLILSLISAGCAHTHTLRWGGGIWLEQLAYGADLNQFTYCYDGNIVGAGKQGYSAALSAISRLPEGSVLRVIPNYEAPLNMLGIPTTQGEIVGGFYRYPYRYFQTLYYAECHGIRIRLDNYTPVSWISEIREKADIILKGQVLSATVTNQIFQCYTLRLELKGDFLNKGPSDLKEGVLDVSVDYMTWCTPVDEPQDAVGRTFVFFLKYSGRELGKLDVFFAIWPEEYTPVGCPKN